MWKCILENEACLKLKRRLVLYILVALNIALIQGCEGCDQNKEKYIACLSSIEGTVERDYSANINQWKTAKLGEMFQLGDGVKTAENSIAVLTLFSGSQIQLGPMAQLRLAQTTSRSLVFGIIIEEGAAEIWTHNEKMEIKTQFGTAVIEGGSRVRIKKNKKGINLSVIIGNAQFTTQANTVEVSQGQTFTVNIENAILLDTPIPKPDQFYSNPSSHIPTDLTGIKPTELPKEPASASETEKRTKRKPKRSKSSDVKKSDAPPIIYSVEADGKIYKLHYNNQLPIVSIRWPGKPQKGNYELHLLDKDGRHRIYRATKPKYRFKAGVLKEETYTVWFQEIESGERSVRTTMQITIHNTFPESAHMLPRDLTSGIGHSKKQNVSLGATLSCANLPMIWRG